MPRAGETTPLKHVGTVQEKAGSFRADIQIRTSAGVEHILGPCRVDLRHLRVVCHCMRKLVQLCR